MGLIIFLLRKDMNMRGNRQTTPLPLTFINFANISNKKPPRKDFAAVS